MSDIDVLQERARILEDLITRAWSDDAFKALLLADPAKAVENAYGLKLPGSLTLKVLEETEDTRYVVLPYRPASCEELSDSELSAIAGGASASDASLTSSGSTRSLVLRGLTVTNPLQAQTLDAVPTLQTTAMC